MSPKKSSPALDTASIDEVVLRFEEAWQRGESPEPAAFIGTGADVRLIAELVHVDLERRLKKGEAVSVESYLERFPLLSEDAEAVQTLRAAFERLHHHLVFDSQTETSTTKAWPPNRSPLHFEPSAAESPDVQQLGRFRIVSCLGEGAFGRVYEAHDPLLDRPVALKVAKLDRSDAPQRIKRFLREAKVAANLRHPHIVPLYEFAQEGDQFFIASAFIRGRTLKDAIDEQKESDWDLKRTARIVRQMAEALAYAHEQGIVHRDIKPANTMLDDKDEPMVMDFGLASRQEEAEQLTHAGQVLGTPLYMAPEQARGKEGAALPASDQYSLGIILFELLTGKRPFDGTPELVMYHHQQTEPPSPRKINPKLPRDLETICLKCLEKEPTRRYADCRALAEDLRRWLADEPILAKKLGLGERTMRWVRRNPVVAGLSAAVVTVLIAGIVVSSYFAVDATEQATLAETRRATADTLAESEKEANKNAKESAAKALIEADRARLNSANLALENGRSFCERGDIAPGLLWFARALELLPPGHLDLERAIRANWSSWHQELHPLEAVISNPSPVLFTAFNEAKNLLAAGCQDKAVYLWEMPTGKAMGRLDHPEKLLVGSMVFSADGKTLITSCGDGRIYRWNTATGKQLQPPRTLPGKVNGLTLSPDKRIYCGFLEKTLHLFDMDSAQAPGVEGA